MLASSGQERILSQQARRRPAGVSRDMESGAPLLSAQEREHETVSRGDSLTGGIRRSQQSLERLHAAAARYDVSKF